MEVVGGTALRGSIDGLAQGDVLVDAIFEGNTDKVFETRGRVLGGGTSLISRELGLAISKNDASIRTSVLIGKAIINVLAPEGGTVLRRSLIGYGVAALYVAAGLVAIRLAT